MLALARASSNLLLEFGVSPVTSPIRPVGRYIRGDGVHVGAGVASGVGGAYLRAHPSASGALLAMVGAPPVSWWHWWRGEWVRWGGNAGDGTGGLIRSYPPTRPTTDLPLMGGRHGHLCPSSMASLRRYWALAWPGEGTTSVRAGVMAWWLLGQVYSRMHPPRSTKLRREPSVDASERAGASVCPSRSSDPVACQRPRARRATGSPRRAGRSDRMPPARGSIETHAKRDGFEVWQKSGTKKQKHTH